MKTASNSKILRAIPLLIAFCLVSSPAQAQYGGGTGEPNDPYLIYTAEQMNNTGLHEEDWDKHFKLMADIDLSDYSYDRALIAADTTNNDTTARAWLVSPRLGFSVYTGLMGAVLQMEKVGLTAGWPLKLIGAQYYSNP